MSATALMAALQLSDSALPTGAFAHSLGFESYLAAETITDADGFASWLASYTRQQLTFTDALAIRLVYGQPVDYRRVDHLVTAQALPQQIREAGITMGRRLLTVCADNYPSAVVAAYAEDIDQRRAFGHPAIVWALAAHELGIDCDDAVVCHLSATVMSLTQNAVRAVPLGQNAGQRVIRQAQPWIAQAVADSARLGWADLGAIAPGLEIAQMNHERQRSRLFMS